MAPQRGSRRRRGRRERHTAGPRIAFFGLLGVGNIGNEASLQAVQRMLLSSGRPARFSSISANPAKVQQDHGIPGVHMRARGNRSDDRQAGLAGRAAAKVRSATRLIGLLRDVDAVVVPGMGVLEDDQGGNPWGMPFDLAALSVAAWVARTDVAYVSVGVSPPQSRLVGIFSRVALRGTTYLTYRDDYSAGVYPMRDRPAHIYPDVAFTLPVARAHARQRGLVVVGVMDYYGPTDDYAIGAADHVRYVDRLVGAVDALIAEGWRVRLLIGDEKDRATVQEVCARVGPATAAISTAEATHFDAVMEEVSAGTVAVVSRYHNLVAALLTSTPTVSLSYAEKGDVLMRSVGLAEFCQHIGEIDTDRLAEQIATLARRGAEVSHQVAERVGALSEWALAQATPLSEAVLPPAGWPGSGHGPSRRTPDPHVHLS